MALIMRIYTGPAWRHGLDHTKQVPGTCQELIFPLKGRDHQMGIGDLTEM